MNPAYAEILGVNNAKRILPSDLVWYYDLADWVPLRDAPVFCIHEIFLEDGSRYVGQLRDGAQLG